MELDPELVKGKEAIDVIDETQEYARQKAVDELKVGDKVVHSRLFISVCRGAARERAQAAVMEVTGLTPRSVTTRAWTPDIPIEKRPKYGPQFDRRYIKKAEA